IASASSDMWKTRRPLSSIIVSLKLSYQAGTRLFEAAHFVVSEPDYMHDDPDGMHPPNHDAAKDHGNRIVYETERRRLLSRERRPPSVIHATGQTVPFDSVFEKFAPTIQRR